MAQFQIHPQLVADTFAVTQLALCRVLLMDDQTYPWLILVPEREGIREIHELTPGDQQQLIQEITQVSRRLQRLAKADKMNVAALGNMVPQLHVHIIARFEGDAAWPGPVWGKQPAQAYERQAVAEFVQKIKNILTV